MNTKKAIETLERTIIPFGGALLDNEANSIIELLQENEKYKQMWEKLRDIYLPDPKVDEGLLKRLMDGLEQKYFPKPVETEKSKLIKEVAEMARELFIEKFEQRFHKFIKEFKKGD